MHESNTEAIRLTERLLGRVDALSGAATAIAATVRNRTITADEVYHLLDVIACDLRHNTELLLSQLTASDSG
jgi:hypothetical protein